MFSLLQSLVSSIVSLFSFLISAIESLLALLTNLPTYTEFLVTSLNLLPSVIIPFALLSVSIYVILFILGRN